MRFSGLRDDNGCQLLRGGVIRGFNEAVNTFTDDGWTTLGSDGMDDVSIVINPTPTMKSTGGQNASDRVLFALGGGILCAKASMLLQVGLLLLGFFIFLCKSSMNESMNK
jgi:hypothetical protein